MAAALLVFLLIALAFMYGGVRLVVSGLRRPPDPAIPPAQLANPEGVERVRGKVARAARKAPGKVGRFAAVTVGLALIAAPWVFVYEVLQGLSDLGGGMSKGRVLRVRGRARLAAPAKGDGWAGEAVVLTRTPSPHERRVLGEMWLVTARMEHASIPAFSQLALHLAALGAPSRLVEACHRAALDEIRHARACFAIVHALTGVRESAGPIAELAAPAAEPIDHVRLAIGSLVDGCVGEGIAADVAARAAERAEEPAIREVLATIARDEAGHAELAWDVLAWCLAEGGAPVARAVGARVELLDRELAPRLPDLPGLDPRALARWGVIDQDGLGAIASARIAATAARASALLAGDARAAA